MPKNDIQVQYSMDLWTRCIYIYIHIAMKHTRFNMKYLNLITWLFCIDWNIMCLHVLRNDELYSWVTKNNIQNLIQKN